MLKYELFIDDKWTDIGSLINSSETSIELSLCSTEWKSVVSMATFTLRYAHKSFYKAIVTKLMESSEVQCRIFIDESLLFSGIVDLSTLQLTSSRIPQSVTVTVKDHMASLSKKIKYNLVLENATVPSILQRLLSLADKNIFTSDIPQELQTRIVEHFVLTEDDSCSISDVIDTLLFEMGGYVLHWDSEANKFKVSLIPEMESTPRKLNYMVGQKLVTTSRCLDTDGVVVKWPTVEVLKNTKVYGESISGSLENGIWKGIAIPAGGFYPKDGDIVPTKQDFNTDLLDKAFQKGESRRINGDLDLLYVRENTLELQINATKSDGSELPQDSFTMPAVPAIGKVEGLVTYPRKAWVLLHNNSNEEINLQSLGLYGDAVYRSKINKVIVPANCYEPYEYDSSFIFNKTDATAFAQMLSNFRTKSQTVVKWTSMPSDYALGDVLEAVHPELERSIRCIVVQKTLSSLTGSVMSCDYIAVSIDNWQSKPVSVGASTSSTTSAVKVVATDVLYGLSVNSDTEPETWMANRPNRNPGMVLWTKERSFFSDGSVETSKAVPVTGDRGENGTSFTTVIESDNGSVFRINNVNTRLMCKVFSNYEDITDSLEDYRFNWERVSGDSSSDQSWNTSSKAIGKKSVEITTDDCIGRTVFICNINLEGISNG